MPLFLVAGAGGFIGVTLRFLASYSLQHILVRWKMPFSTMIINIIGCLIIGILGGLAESRAIFSSQLKVFLFIGVLGGFTTFSSFSFETLTLLRDGSHLMALINIFGSLIFGLAAVTAGLYLGKAL